MGKVAPTAAAGLLAAFAGCLTTAPNGYGNLSESAVMSRVREVLPKAAEKAVTSPAGVPSVQGVGGSTGSSGHPGGWHSEYRFRYTFRLVKGPPDWHQDRDRSWALPDAEYPRVIRAVYADVCAAAEAAGATLTESRCEGATFVVRYQVTSTGGKVITGTLRGLVGPEDTHNHTPPPAEAYYTQVAVDVREEAGDGK